MLLAALLTTLAATSAHAEDPGQLRDFCAHRPGKATPPCLIDPGRLMVEIDGFDFARTRDAGVTQDATVVLSPDLRFGLTPAIEASLNLAPYVRLRTRAAGQASATSGTGDSQFALTWSLKNPDGSGTSVAVEAFAGLPTAQHGLGAGGFQGGFVIPIAFTLPAGLSLTLDPEIDALRTAGGGLHPAYAGAVALSRGLGQGLTGSVELWASQDQNPAGHVAQATFDAALAWISKGRPNLQLDGGVNFGLDRAAPDVQAYVGVSRRF